MFEKQLNIKVKSIKVEVRLNETDKASSIRLIDSFHLYIFLNLNLCDSEFKNKNFKVLFKHHYLFVQYTKEIDSVNGFPKQQYLL